MSKVVIEDVYKIYPDTHGKDVVAVEGASLTVENGEFMVFVGPSGCGKSTTLRMIAGLEEISRGSVYIDDRKVNDVPPKDRDIAMVFQNYALYPHMSVFQNMAFGLQLRKVPKDEINGRVTEAAQILGLNDDMLKRKPKALSGGQRQRVALGRAIVRKPKVFLFDEPLSNLDAKMRVQMRTEISKLHGQLGSTMIYVTHDQVEAMTMGDRICLMKHGRIQQVAVPLEIYNKPANMFVAAFIGSPPMNFFEGTIVRKGDGIHFLESTNRPDPNAFMIKVASDQESKLDGWIGKEIIFGIRPEDLQDVPVVDEKAKKQSIVATVEVTEPMGAETYFYLRTGNHSFVLRAPGQLFERVGHKVSLLPRMEKARFFEKADKSAFQSESGEVDTERWQTACRLII